MTLHRANVFSQETPVDPEDYYVPGNEGPAVSIADYYHIDGPYWMRPYDLNSWGSPGQAIAASRGRYWWVCSPDHAASSLYRPWAWRDGANFMAGYTDQPGVFPASLATIIPGNNRPTGIPPEPGDLYSTYEAPWCLYNPDDTDDLPFYLYAESAGGELSHSNILWRSDDLLVWTPMQDSHYATGAGWGAFQRVTRLGVGDWISTGHGGETSYLGTIKRVSTDGQTFTSPEVPLKRFINGSSTYSQVDSQPAESGTSEFGISAADYVTISGQRYALASERTEANANTNQFSTTPYYLSLVPIDSNYNVITSPSVIRLAGPYEGIFPGPGWLQDVNAYQEDGVLHIYAFRGSPSQVNTYAVANAFVGVPYIPTTNICEFTGSITGTALTVTSVEYGSIPYTYDYLITGAGISGSCGVTATTGGAGFAGTYTVTSSQTVAPGTAMVMANPNQVEGGAGGLVEKFCDYHTYIYDATAAAAAAPVGVTASCAAGTVTLSWYDALPNDTYRVKRYTSASNAASNTSPTTVGDVTGESTTDTPTPGQQYWYRVYTLESGTERGYHIVRAYCSSASSFVNKHIDRVIEDGGDASTIDVARLTAIDDWLDDNGFKNSLLHWVDARFGIKKDGGDVVEKVYDLGTTWLPRGGDLTTVGSSTTYDAAALDSSIPGWINGTSTARAYFGGGTRFNQIRRKNQLTVAALYERGTTAADCTFLGTSTSSGGLGGHQNNDAFNGTTAGISLVHEAGTPGTIKFNVQDNTGGTSTKVTASVAADSGTLLTAIGSYDGTSMVAYSNGTAGSADNSLNPNPYFMDDTALAGARGLLAATPVLASGTKDAIYTIADGNLPFVPGSFTFGQSNALFTAGALVVLGKGLTAPQAASLDVLLRDTGTVNIKVDYSAAGDGQKLTTTITASGTTVSSPTALWVPGDVGAAFGSIELWDLGSTYFVTITAVAGDGKSVTLSTAVGHSRTAQATTIEWGTDDTQAFLDFMDDYNDNTSSVILDIPSGRYIFAASLGAGEPFANIKTLEVHGDPDDPPVLSDLCSCGGGYFVGGTIGQNQSDNLHSARTDTVAAGSTTIQLADASQRTRFSAGTWALMTGIELDGGSLGGSPTTPNFYEFVFMTNVSVGGLITLSDPLANTYKSTWPVYQAGSGASVDYGGPATLYALDLGWDVDHIYQDLVFDSEFGGIPAQGRNITLRRCTVYNQGVTGTVNRDYTLDNVDMPENNSEIFDKIQTNVTLTDSTFRAITFQSPSPTNLTMTRCTVAESFNTPVNATLVDCDFAATDIKLGPTNAAGVSATASGTSFGGFHANHHTGGETDVFGTGGWTLTGGVFSRVKIGAFVPPIWAIPGRKCMLTGQGYFASVFRVIDVYEDGTNIYVSTDLTGMPNIPSAGGAYTVEPLPPAITFTNCDGCVDAEAWSLAPPGAPLYTYFRRAYTGNIGTSEPPAQVVGRLISVTITVSGYSGGTLGLDGPLVLRQDTGAFASWTPSIDLTTAGTRVITPTGGDPSLGSDSGLVLPSTQIWMVANQVTPKMSGSTGSGSLSIEIITSQGQVRSVVPSRLRLRLHA